MAIDHEKDREGDLESAMYTNCLLLGLDPAIMAGWNSRVGHFRHSNPRLGEQLLHFILSSLRGPVQSAKDFDRVWPIFDSTQSRDFRKIVQGIISELESKGALPRNNARISSLATCCGPRFVELLWQLSVHTLREVHRRTFSSDVSSNPLPASLTDVSYQNAAALVPVTKARVALERRKFLRNANAADQRQTAWANIANEMTAEFRELCAEEAYLEQELEKMQEIRNKANLDGELWDDRISSSSVQNSLLVSKATRLWESLLSHKSQHEVLASGPIEDLIAHREHRYRISGSSLAAAMELSGYVPPSDLLSNHTSKKLSSIDIHEKRDSLQFQGNHDNLSRPDNRIGRVHHTVDVAEVLRRWTHALQRVHKQSLNMAKANDGVGPELLQSENGSDGHTESLAAALAEHRQHLVSLQGLVDQLKAAIPDVQESIGKLTEEVNAISPISLNEKRDHSVPPVEAQSNVGSPNNSSDAIITTETSPSLGSEKVSKHRALKLPHLFNISPNWSRKNTREGKRHDADFVPEKSETLPAENSGEDSEAFARNLRRAVREAALSGPSSNSDIAGDKASNAGSEHFFVSLLRDVSQKEVEAVGIPRKLHVMSSCGFEESLEQVSPPSLLDDEPLFDDCYEDLLDPLSESDAALMESCSQMQHNLAR